ncbi:hypothetical protein IKF63_01550 [Candidatus Saccharibacteria bacterium]|nr:hypothetical protein [Candidatus Saccharibacteria bacterium]
MMSGYLVWDSSNLGYRGTYGYFWASTLLSYIDSRGLLFYSTHVYPKANNAKPDGLPLRRVARPKPHPRPTSIHFRNFPPRSKFFARFLPELSAASLFRL